MSTQRKREEKNGDTVDFLSEEEAINEGLDEVQRYGNTKKRRRWGEARFGVDLESEIDDQWRFDRDLGGGSHRQP